MMKMNFVSISLALPLSLAFASGCEDASDEVATVSAPDERAGASHIEPTMPASTLAPASITSPSVVEEHADETAEPEGERVAAPSAPELRPIRDLELGRLALTRRVEAREPTDPSARFAVTAEPLYAFIEARNAGEDAEPLVVTFVGPDGRRTGDVELTIPANAPRWRTWAFTRYANAPGAWSVEVRTLDGELVGRQRFVME